MPSWFSHVFSQNEEVDQPSLYPIQNSKLISSTFDALEPEKNVIVQNNVPCNSNMDFMEADDVFGLDLEYPFPVYFSSEYIFSNISSLFNITEPLSYELIFGVVVLFALISAFAVFVIPHHKKIFARLKLYSYDGRKLDELTVILDIDSRKKNRNYHELWEDAHEMAKKEYRSWNVNIGEVILRKTLYYSTIRQGYVEVLNDKFELYSAANYCFLIYERSPRNLWPENYATKEDQTRILEKLNDHSLQLKRLDDNLCKIPDFSWLQKMFEQSLTKSSDIQKSLDSFIADIDFRFKETQQELKILETKIADTSNSSIEMQQKLRNLEMKMEEVVEVMKSFKVSNEYLLITKKSPTMQTNGISGHNDEDDFEDLSYETSQSSHKEINNKNPHPYPNLNKFNESGFGNDGSTYQAASIETAKTDKLNTQRYNVVPSHAQKSASANVKHHSITDNEKVYSVDEGKTAHTKVSNNSIKIPISTLKSIKRSPLEAYHEKITLGQAYNISNGELLSSCVFEEIIEGTHKQLTWAPVTSTIITKHDIETAFDALKIEPDTQINILTGIVPMPTMIKQLMKPFCTSLILKGIRKNLRLISTNRVVISNDFINNGSNGSHYVSEVEYGFTVILTLKESGENNLEEIMNSVVDSIIQKKILCPESLFEFPIEDLYVDYKLKSFHHPTGLKETIELLSKMVYSDEDFIGPIRYSLLPVSTIRNNKPNLEIREIPINVVSDFIDNFSQLQTKKGSMENMYRVITSYHAFLDISLVQNILQQKDKYQSDEAMLMSRITNMIQNYRQGRLSETDLDAQIKSTFRNIYEKIENLHKMVNQDSLKKIEYIQSMQERGVLCLNNNNDLQEKLRNNAMAHVFFGKVKEIFQDSKSLSSKNGRLFDKIVGEEKHTAKIFVDSDTSDINVVHSKISIYQNSQIHTEDVLYQMKQEKSQSCLLMTTEKKVQVHPSQLTTLKLICPHSIDGHCPDEVQTWACETCAQEVQYGSDKRFHCKCGSASAFSYEFKCNDIDHGDTFYSFSDYLQLKEKLRDLIELDEQNILIYGESGVGKSTLINALTNYFKYENFEEAKSSPPTYLIPSVFSIRTLGENPQNNRIHIGDPKPEEVKLSDSGYSVTQYPKAYVFKLGQKTIRFIDTPGINDTRGGTRDKLNFEEILRYISTYEKIHAVCILLKPDIARSTVNIRNFINPLLSHLQKGAVSNIIYCFTHATLTHFSHGDSYTTLRNYFEETKNYKLMPNDQNTFYVDSDSYKYLWSIHRNVHLSSFDEKQLGYSWTVSKKDMQKMVDYISRLTPQSIDDMISVSQERVHIQQLTQPLIDTMANLQFNIDLMESGINKLENYAKNKQYGRQESLNDFKLMQTIIEEQTFPQPRAVCLSTCCNQLGNLGSINIKQPFYNQICHDSCYFDLVSEENQSKTYDPYRKLARCRNFLNNKCSKCSCSSDEHVRICYVKRIRSYVYFEFNNLSVVSSNELNTRLQSFKNYLNGLKEERATILKNCVEFYCFMKRHQIFELNDYFEENLNDSIAHENRFGNTMLAQGLKDLLKTYSDERGNAEKMEKQPVSAKEVKNLQEQIFKLKHVGKKVNDLYKAVLLCEDIAQHQGEEHWH